MKFNKKIVLYLGICFFINISASAHEVGFFLLKDRKITAVKALSLPLETIELDENPFWTIKDIKEYRCTTHEFKLTDEGTAAVPFPESVQGIPFVLKVSGKAIYIGAFFSFFSSEVFPNPVVDVTLPPKVGKVWKFDRAYPHDGYADGVDPRMTTEFLDELRFQGKLTEECPAKN